MGRFSQKFKLSGIAITHESVYRHVVQKRSSYKAMQKESARYDAIQINSRVDHFTFAIVDRTFTRGVSISLSALLQTFHWKIWVSLLGCAGFVILSMSMIGLNFSESKQLQKILHLFETITLLIFASTVDQSQSGLIEVKRIYKRTPDIARKQTASRVMIMCWLLIAFGFSNSYKSVMLACFIHPSLPSLPENLDQLLASKIRINVRQEFFNLITNEHCWLVRQ
jgi:hypothetical protein